jgi:hypothetical protein
LLDLVVERFDALAKENGSTCWWKPETSQVIGTVYGEGKNMWREKRKDGKPDTTAEELEEWRGKAGESVMNDLVDGKLDHLIVYEDGKGV